jgi:hypothetical protein
MANAAAERIESEARIARMRAELTAIEEERLRLREAPSTWAVAREDRGWALGFAVSTLVSVALAGILAWGPAHRASAIAPRCPEVVSATDTAQVVLPAVATPVIGDPTPAPTRPALRPNRPRRIDRTEETLRELDGCGDDPTCGLSLRP